MARRVCRGLGRWWRCWGVAVEVEVEVEVEVVGEGGVLQRGVAVRWQDGRLQMNADSRAGQLLCGVTVVWLYAGWVLQWCMKRLLDRNRVRGCS